MLLLFYTVLTPLNQVGAPSYLVIRYVTFMITGANEDIKATNIKTRKLLSMQGRIHPLSRTLRLYTKMKVPVSIRANVQDKTTNIQVYIRKVSLNEYIRQQNPTEEEEE